MGRMSAKLGFCIAVCAAACPAQGGEKAEHLKMYPLLPRVSAPLLDSAPNVDGKLDDDVWRKAAALSPFRPSIGGPNGAGPRTDVMIACTREALFFGIRCHEKDLANLQGRKGGFGDDDAVEIFIRAGNLPHEPYHQFSVNCAGAYEDEYNRSSLWDAKGAKVAVGREDGAWTVELLIPFRDMVLPEDKDVLAGPWRLNIIRMRPMHPGDKKPGGMAKETASGERYNEETAWSPTETDSSHLPHMFGYLFVEAYGGKLPGERREKP